MIPVERLDAHALAEIRELLAAGAQADGEPALDEAGRLAVEDGSARHLLRHEDGALVGFAQILPDATVQGLVHPRHRRRGHGTALLQAVLAVEPDPRVWVHGVREESDTLLSAHGFTAVRELLVLGRHLDEAAAAEVAERARRPLPPDVQVRPLSVATDAEELLALNARAFAHHPEQGRWAMDDLRRRFEEPWFDPDDVLLGLREGAIAAVVWLKRVDGEPAEVYLVGTDPAHQGRGLAGILLDRALQRLTDQDAEDVILYVEGDNVAALALYERRGFTPRSRHRQLRRGAQDQPQEDACA